jgi:hypothetical protein
VRKAPKRGSALWRRDASSGAIRFPIDKLRGSGRGPDSARRWGGLAHGCADEKKQLFHRLSPEVVGRTLEAFNDGALCATDACTRLGIGRSQLYELRTRWLAHGRHLPLQASGGDHTAPWPAEVVAFLRDALVTGEQPNFAFLADELTRRFGFRRAASNIRHHVREHFPELLREPLRRGPKPRRRWQREGYGDLLQHDSSPHQWWPGERLQILAMTIDDATRYVVGAGFIEAETTFAHLAHVRGIFLLHGLPNAFYTDGLSLFGHESRKAGDTDTLTQFQRALGCLGVSHLVAPDPQSKGKIERQFGFWQKRLPALFRIEAVSNREQADELLAAQIAWHHAHHVSRTTGMTPDQAVENSIERGTACWRPTPDPALLDLHLAIHHSRAVQKASQISFLGKRWDIAPTNVKTVTIVEHPDRFRVISAPPTPHAPRWPDILADYRI